MSLIPFDTLPDSSRLWVFHSARTLTDAELGELRARLERFLEGWAAHRRDLTAGYDLRYHQFMLLGVDESKLPPSGCSIDSLVHELERIGTEMGVEMVDAPDIPFRDDGNVRCVSRAEFGALAAEGAVNASTIVFDRTAARVGDVRHGAWERPAAEAWHGRAFNLREPA